MTRPKKEHHVRQVAAWLPGELKEKLDKRAAEEKKPARTVVAEALEAHLQGKEEPKK